MATIILVEDDDDDVLLVQQALERMTIEEGIDIRLISLTSGTKLIERISNDRPDGIVLDINLPCIDGLDLLMSIRKNGSGNIPVILFSGSGCDDERVKLADSFLLKRASDWELSEFRRVFKEVIFGKNKNASEN